MLAFDLYRNWETDLRPITLAALRKMSPEQLAWKPQGWDHSAWELAVHMAQCEWHWIYRIALKKVPWESRWDPNRFADLGELVEFWTGIHRTTVEWLKDTPVSQLNRKYPMPFVEQPYATMNWLVYHVMEHEIHHRGQIFMLMRMQGVTPPEI